MTQKDLGTLNSLVTFAAENIPGGLNHDEEVVAKVVGIWAFDGVPVCQICPHCEAVAPFGPGRLAWLKRHNDSDLHRRWWELKGRLQDLQERFTK
jgi:hypothetical protein